MKGKTSNVWQRWVRTGLVVCLVLGSLFVAAGCTRSKSQGVPTPKSTAMATVPVDLIASPTVISAEDTPTPGMTPPPPTVAPAEETPTPSPLPTDTPPVPGALTYTVQAGDTLYSIAKRYNVTVDEIMALNGITDPTAISVGQVLTIRPGAVPPTTPGPPQETVHIVQRGENLFRIALRYGTTVQAIANRNNIVNPSLIWVGQKLTIPTGGETSPPSSNIHVVQPGENLYRIALRYGTTPWAIAVANGLSSTHYIYVGQRLRIP